MASMLAGESISKGSHGSSLSWKNNRMLAKRQCLYLFFVSRTRKECSADEGRISVLVVGLSAIVLAVLLVGASLTGVHLQHRRLLSCADRVSAVASGAINAHDYYLGDAGSQRVVPDAGQVGPRAAQALEQLLDTTCNVGGGVALLDVSVRDEQVQVTVRAQADLIVLPRWFSSVTAPILTARSSARTL